MDIVIVVLIVAVILWAIYSMYGDGRQFSMGGGTYMPGVITILLVVILVIILLRLI